MMHVISRILKLFDILQVDSSFVALNSCSIRMCKFSDMQAAQIYQKSILQNPSGYSWPCQAGFNPNTTVLFKLFVKCCHSYIYIYIYIIYIYIFGSCKRCKPSNNDSWPNVSQCQAHVQAMLSSTNSFSSWPVVHVWHKSHRSWQNVKYVTSPFIGLGLVRWELVTHTKQAWVSLVQY